MTTWDDQALEQVFGHRLRRQESLARHSTFHAGGPADLFVAVGSSAELALAVGLAGAAEIPVRVLGSGANVLPADAGVRGLIVRNVSRQFRLERDDELVHVDSGTSLPVLARRTARLGLAGLTWACGVPGTVGGGIANNAGCYGFSMSNTLVSVRTVDARGAVREWTAGELSFGYRASPFKGRGGDRPELPVAILGASFRLVPHRAEELLRQMEAWLERRAATQPLDLRSAGSFFKNPDGDYAGRLVEAAGLKGRRRGGAQVSKKHANFFVNTGTACAADLYWLAREVQQIVEERTGVRLEFEVELIGDWSSETLAGQAA